jgi:hypothetical protein
MYVHVCITTRISSKHQWNMHRYEEQSVSCGGTDAQSISGSIHTRHLVWLFNVAVWSRCRKMYAVQSLERSSGRITAALITPERRWTAGCRRSAGTNRSCEQSRRCSPKIWSPTHSCKCISADGDFEGLLSHSLCAHRKWDGNVLFAIRVRDVTLLEEPSPLHSYRQSGGRQRTEMVMHKYWKPTTRYW